jgi:hypothetical protein
MCGSGGGARQVVGRICKKEIAQKVFKGYKKLSLKAHMIHIFKNL